MNRAWKIFSLALTIKLSVLAFFLHIRPGLTNWGVNEAGMIARSLVLNHSYGGAFHDAPSPTEWLAPAYPTVVAVIFSVVGVVQVPLRGATTRAKAHLQSLRNAALEGPLFHVSASRRDC